MARSWNSLSSDAFEDIEFTNSGTIILIRYVRDTCNFGAGLGGFERINNGNVDIVVMRLKVDGSSEWVNTHGGILGDFGNAIAINSIGDIAAVRISRTHF